MRPDFFDLQTVIVPADACIVCGAAWEAGGETCARCGTTVDDIRTLLRAGADAYARARNAALEMRFDEARERLAIAASLGFGFVPAFAELSATIYAIDVPVTTKQADDYAVAHHLSLAGKFAAAQNIALADTPITRELTRLSCNSARRLTQDRTVRWVRTALIAAFCVLLASLFR